jgi:predicted DNA-binding protein (UPF0251 family)
MSPRSKRLRKVINPPPIKGYKPYGPETNKKEKGIVTLHFEEYEALRLCDYDNHNHSEASKFMGVSRPTFTRIYASARQKIALAFVEGLQISIEGGKVYFDSDWFHCKSCKCYFNNPEKDQKTENCPLCGSTNVIEAESETENSPEEIMKDECADSCECPQCGYQQPHRYGKPCSLELCPTCNIHLKRKPGPNFHKFNHKGRKNTK